MPQMVSQWPLSAEAWIQSQVTACGIFSEQSDTDTCLSSSTLVFPCKYHSTNALHSSSSSYNSIHKDKQAKPGNLQTKL